MGLATQQQIRTAQETEVEYLHITITITQGLKRPALTTNRLTTHNATVTLLKTLTRR